MNYLLLYMLALYLVFFLPPLTAGTWRFLAGVICINAAFVYGLAKWAEHVGGILILAFIPPVTAIAAGLLAGSVTRAALLATGKRLRSRAGIAMVLAGASSIPLTLVGHSYYRDWAASAAYARLPSALTLPSTPACEAFRPTGPLLDAVIVSEARADRTPAVDIHVRYPVAYRSPFPSRVPGPMPRESWIELMMHIADSSPASREEEKDGDGRWIPEDRREPAVLFRLRSREPVARSASRLLRAGFGEYAPSGDTPSLQLVPSPYADLAEVKNEMRIPEYQERFVSMRDGAIAALVQCSEPGRYPNPQCSFEFDHLGVAVEGRFRRAVLAEWPRIKGGIENFIGCTLVERIPTAKG